MLSEHNNIDKFDELFRSELGNHSVQAPEGVWEQVASQIGTTAGTTVTTVAAKSLLTVKTIIATITTAAIITAAVILVNNNTQKDIQQNTPSQTEQPQPVLTPGHTGQSSVISETPVVVNETPLKSQSAEQNNTQALQIPSEKGNTPATSEKQHKPLTMQETQTPATVMPQQVQTTHQEHTQIKPQQPDKSTPVQQVQTHNCRDARKANARFSFNEEEEGRFTFTAERAAQTITWNFDDNSETVTGSKPEHIFYPGERNTYNVMAVAVNNYGCRDTFWQKITSHYFAKEGNPFCPNIFTPDGDGINDEYVVKISGEESFNIRIYDKNNKLVFETSDKTTGWNGNLRDGSKAQYGTYYYVLNYKLTGKTAQRKSGSLMMIAK